jgi:hypothetical protein
MQIKTSLVSKFSLVIFLAFLLASSFSSLLPKHAFASTQSSALLLVGQKCHDLDEITQDQGVEVIDGSIVANSCHSSSGGGWEELLVSNLGCSDQMFYTHEYHTDPNDSSVTDTKWYTSEGRYKDCYNRAINQYNYINNSDGPCHLMKKDSDNWGRCTKEQDQLHASLGCDNSLFQQLKSGPNDGYWATKPGAMADCKKRIDQVGAVHIIIPNDSSNKGEPSANAIADAAVAADQSGSAGHQNGVSGDSTHTSQSADCDSSGVNLSWILCPVFDMMSDFSHWMLQNILQPFLITTPISTESSDPSYQIWSNFRIYGDIFLIIALLVIVFGQSIGGGMIDAYTAKKVLPRLLAAAVLINLSIYIVAFLVDFTNVLGKGMSDIIASPLTHCTNSNGGNCWSFQLTGSDQASIFGVGLIGLLATSPAIIGFLAAVFFNPAVIGTALFAGFLVMIPIVFAIIGVFVTLIIRQGLILMLVLVSPVAFALYCLPNTEKYFRKWWELLIEALMVYPIVILIFGVADIMSVTILQANAITPADLNSGGSHHITHGLAVIVAFLLQFIPLLAIPFAFRFASGTLRRVYDAASTAGQRLHSATERRREQAKMDYRASSLTGRARSYHAAQDWGQKNQGPLGIGRRLGRFAANRAGGYNIEALMSEARAQKAKQLNDQIATGRDEEVRGLTVDKASALAKGRGAMFDKTFENADGTKGAWRTFDARTGQAVGGVLADDDLDKNFDYRVNEDGTRSFQSLGGAWVSEQDVDSGYKRWGRDQFAQQAALSYEMRKGIMDNQRKRIDDKFMDLATSNSGWGMTDGEANGAWIGSAFENQNTNLSNKYKSRTKEDDGKYRVDFNRRGYVGEVYEKRSSQAMSQMSADDIQELTNAANAGDLTQEDKMKLRAIKETMEYRLMAARAGTADQERPLDGEGTQAISYGSGHVTEKMQQFVDAVNKKNWES